MIWMYGIYNPQQPPMLHCRYRLRMFEFCEKFIVIMGVFVGGKFSSFLQFFKLNHYRETSTNRFFNKHFFGWYCATFKKNLFISKRIKVVNDDRDGKKQNWEKTIHSRTTMRVSKNEVIWKKEKTNKIMLLLCMWR